MRKESAKRRPDALLSLSRRLRDRLGGPSAEHPIISRVFEVHIACSGQDCEEELEVVVGDLAELEGLSCECGYGFVLLALGEVELVSPTRAEVIRLRDDDLPLAA